MKKKNNNNPLSFTVIDVDSETKEPIFREISHEEYEERVESGANNSPYITVSEENVESVGKQIVMNKVFGIDERDAVSKRQKFFKTLATISFFVLVIGVLCWTAYKDFFSSDKQLPPKKYLKEIFSDRWYFIFFTVFSVFLCYFFKGLKLSLISKKIRGKGEFGVCMATGLLGLYYNYATPFAMGGQPFEIYYLTKHGFTGGEATSATLSTFILHQIAFVVCGVVSVIMFASNALKIPDLMISAIPTVISAVAIFGLCLAASVPFFTILFSFNPKIGAKIVDFVFFIGGKLKIVKSPEKSREKTVNSIVSNANCLKRLSRMPVLFTAETVLSFAEQLANCSIAYFTLKFFGFNWNAQSGIAEWLQVVQLCFILYAAISFIPTPGNSGAADLSFYLLFDTGLGISADIAYGGLAFPAMLVWRFFSFYIYIIIGFIFTAIDKKRKKKIKT